MGLSIVRARLSLEAHQTPLRRFVCCDGGPEGAMDAQRYIRGLNIRRHADDSEIMLIVVEGATAYADTVLGFCEYGVASETADDEPGFYQISYIATALESRGKHLGDLLLAAVLNRLRDDAFRTGRTPFVLTQIDPRNKPSIALFRRFGFSDEGEDSEDPAYHFWSLEFTPESSGEHIVSSLVWL